MFNWNFKNLNEWRQEYEYREKKNRSVDFNLKERKKINKKNIDIYFNIKSKLTYDKGSKLRQR